jgi:hypothetical protein
MNKKKKIILTDAEYRELKNLMMIVKDKTKLPGERRLAMAKFDRILFEAKNRNINR